MNINVQCIRGEFPHPQQNNSQIEILGLFHDLPNSSKPDLVAVQCRAMFKAAIILSQHYNITIERQSISWRTVESGGNFLNALDESCQIVSNSNVVGIVGPALSREAHVMAIFAKRIGIPAISYSATDPDLSNSKTYSTFYRTVPSDDTAATATAELFLKFNWTSCIIIYQNDQFGWGGAKALIETFHNYNLTVEYSIEFDISTKAIKDQLQDRLKNSFVRIVMVWAESVNIYPILQNALDGNVLGPEFTWILSESIDLNTFNESVHSKLLGMLVIEPTVANVVNLPINTTLLDASFKIWQQYENETFPGETNVNSYALFTFDATWSLIVSLQNLCSNSTNNSQCISLNGPPYCFRRRLSNTNLFINTIRAVNLLGISGYIQFNQSTTNRINGTNYLLKNVRFLSNSLNYVPVLKRTTPGTWEKYTDLNEIRWPGNSTTPPTGRASLKGVRLRIGLIEIMPFTQVKNVISANGQSDVKLVGYIPDLIQHLQDRIGFIPQFELAALNQTYLGLVQSVANGVYDIVAADVTITSTRRKLVSFSSPIFDNSMSIIIRKTPFDEIDFWSYLKPFSYRLWLLIFIAWLLSSIIYCFVEHQNNDSFKDKSLYTKVYMSMWFCFCSIMQYGLEFSPKTPAGRILTSGIYILSLVLVATYTANLTSDLTVTKTRNPISGLEDLKNGRISSNRIGIRLGTAGEEFYLREISDGSRNFHPLKDRKDLYEKLLSNSIDASFLDAGIAEYVTNNVFCNLTIAGASFDKSAFGIVIPKKWIYAQELDIHILSLRESGILDELRRKWFEVNICSNLSNKSDGVTVEAMCGLFLTFAIICSVSILLFLWSKRHNLRGFFFELIVQKISPLLKRPNIGVQRKYYVT